MKKIMNRRKLILLGIDVAIIASAYAFVMALLVITNTFLADDVQRYLLNFALVSVFLMASRFAFRIYDNMWRYANSRVFLEMVVSDFVGGVLAFLATLVIDDIYIGGWESIVLIVVLNLLTLVSRFVYQQVYKITSLYDRDKTDNKITVAIAGAGRVGALLAEELLSFSGSHYLPVCFIDNNGHKVGSRVSGLPVYDQSDKTLEMLKDHNIQEIIIAIPQLEGEAARELLEFYGRLGCKVKIYDFPYNKSDSTVSSDKRVVREFDIEDLLFRKAIDVTDAGTKAFYKGKKVLITGGGGSIGSELARQVAKCQPEKLVIFDIYENNAYDIEQELRKKYGSALDLSVEIGSVRDVKRLDAVFSYYRPDIVFHAAAHKHVPLMEHSNCEAIKNNCIGTYNTANVSEKYGVKKFILISTDKAVNPTNVMGASKRMCEMIIQSRSDSDTAFSAVRFGNVLGSNGSVIPLFKRQIMQGGPVTVTDKRIIRYFMTIPEASGLVMQAGAMAKCGELFVLDMGKPVKIYDLAENMIKLSGFRPHVDIEIVETGLRPGEKLYEELLIKTETLMKTDNNLIFIEKDTPLTREEVDRRLDVLREAVVDAENDIASSHITEAMKQVVPTFHSPEEVNKTAEDSDEMKVSATV